MKFNQYYLECLSQASYLIGDETSGRAVIVDPQRDVGEYSQDAADTGLTIEFVIETHFHADFVSGRLELAEATGATILYSSDTSTSRTRRCSSTVTRHRSARDSRLGRSTSWSTAVTYPTCNSWTCAAPARSPTGRSPARSRSP